MVNQTVAIPQMHLIKFQSFQTSGSLHNKYFQERAH